MPQLDLFFNDYMIFGNLFLLIGFFFLYFSISDFFSLPLLICKFLFLCQWFLNIVYRVSVFRTIFI